MCPEQKGGKLKHYTNSCNNTLPPATVSCSQSKTLALCMPGGRYPSKKGVLFYDVNPKPKNTTTARQEMDTTQSRPVRDGDMQGRNSPNLDKMRHP
jgi:hypothetical protein